MTRLIPGDVVFRQEYHFDGVNQRENGGGKDEQFDT